MSAVCSPARSQGRSRSAVSTASTAVVLALLIALTLPSQGEAFRFTIVPNTLKCFTNDPPEEGRYELRYRMSSSLAPFVSVSVTDAADRVLLEHEPAVPDAKNIFKLKQKGAVAICFHASARAATATSLNVTLTLVDAEDAELTRMKKQAYTTSSPIALGVSKGSGALRQMRYITDTLRQMRFAVMAASVSDQDVAISMRAAEEIAWRLIYVLIAGVLAISLINYWRIRSFLRKRNLVAKKK